jgi:hypothetical protein
MASHFSHNAQILLDQGPTPQDQSLTGLPLENQTNEEHSAMQVASRKMQAA